MRTETIALSDIESVSAGDLKSSRLRDLENGYHTFSYLFENNASLSDPIVVSKHRRPYVIINGRHRIFLARQKGYRSVQCLVQG